MGWGKDPYNQHPDQSCPGDQRPGCMQSPPEAEPIFVALAICPQDRAAHPQCFLPQSLRWSENRCTTGNNATKDQGQSSGELTGEGQGLTVFGVRSQVHKGFQRKKAKAVFFCHIQLET